MNFRSFDPYRELSGLPLLEQVNETKPFNTGRWECLQHPQRAAMILGPYAELEVTIRGARNLLPSHSTNVKVFLDDKEIYQTSPCNTGNNHGWNHTNTIGITVARSMVRLHVYNVKNEHQEPLGFVEFCVGDIPFDTVIDGWMELRFASNLQCGNLTRYATHCEEREELAHERLRSLENEQSIAIKFERIKAMKNNFNLASSDETRQVSHKVKRTRCGKLIRDFHHRTRSFGSTETEPCSKETKDEDLRYNAGELSVWMKLSLSGTRCDSLFALALDPPCMWFSSSIQEENLPQMNLQELADDCFDFKIKIFDDLFFSMFTYTFYLLTWQCKWLSGLIMVAFIYTAFDPGFVWVTMQGLIALLLLLNSVECLRLDMTTGGYTAPLTQEGFERVARWNSLGDMCSFISRVIAGQGWVLQDRIQLRFFVAHIYDNGKPKHSLENVIEALRNMGWVERPDGAKKAKLVRVDTYRRATVLEEYPDGKCHVAFDELGGEHQSCVHKERISNRLYIPHIPEAVTPSVVKHMVQEAAFDTEQLKELFFPTVNFLNGIVTWRRPMITFLIFAYFAIRSTLSVLDHIFGIVWATKVVRAIRSIKFIGFFIVGFGLLFAFSLPLQWVRSIGKICRSFPQNRMRPAPKNWAFLNSE